MSWDTCMGGLGSASRIGRRQLNWSMVAGWIRQHPTYLFCDSERKKCLCGAVEQEEAMLLVFSLHEWCFLAADVLTIKGSGSQ